jgi:hypothetical protein
MLGYNKDFFQLKKPVAVAANIGGMYLANQLISPQTPSMRGFVIIGGAMTGMYMYNSLGLGQADDLFNDPVRGLAKAAEDVSEGRGNLLEYGAVGLGGYGAVKGASYLFGGSEAAAGTEATEIAAAGTEGIESVGLFTEVGTSLLEGLEFLPLLLF